MARLLTEKEYIEKEIKELAYIKTCEKYNVIYLSELSMINRQIAEIYYHNLIEQYSSDQNIIQKIQFYYDRMINKDIITIEGEIHYKLDFLDNNSTFNSELIKLITELRNKHEGLTNLFIVESGLYTKGFRISKIDKACYKNWDEVIQSLNNTKNYNRLKK